MQKTRQKAATTPENIARIDAMFHRIEAGFENLAERWLDECKYEDIAEYGRVIQTWLPAGFKLTAMMKRPFGFRFNIGTDAEYTVTITNSKYEWKRVA